MSILTRQLVGKNTLHILWRVQNGYKNTFFAVPYSA